MKNVKGLYPLASMVVTVPGTYIGTDKAAIVVYEKS
jgi:hypothetical protein